MTYVPEQMQCHLDVAAELGRASLDALVVYTAASARGDLAADRHRTRAFTLATAAHTFATLALAQAQAQLAAVLAQRTGLPCDGEPGAGAAGPSSASAG